MDGEAKLMTSLDNLATEYGTSIHPNTVRFAVLNRRSYTQEDTAYRPHRSIFFATVSSTMHDVERRMMEGMASWCIESV